MGKKMLHCWLYCTVSYFQTMSPINLRAGTPLISTSTSGAWISVKFESSGSLLIISRARIWSWKWFEKIIQLMLISFYNQGVKENQMLESNNFIKVQLQEYKILNRFYSSSLQFLLCITKLSYQGRKKIFPPKGKI